MQRKGDKHRRRRDGAIKKSKKVVLSGMRQNEEFL
jgi:hypothetical protein